MANKEQCSHDWEEAKYDPEIKKYPYGYEFHCKENGHLILKPRGYNDVEIRRWSRTCKKCGKVEYTKKEVPVKFEPVFN